MKFVLVSFVFFLLGSLTTLVVVKRETLPIFPIDKFLNREVKATPAAGVVSRNVDWARLQKEVLPEEGFRLPVSFEDLGPKLVKAGAIDLAKFESNFAPDGGLTAEQKTILTEKTELPISINQKNSTFMVDFFWALGLANKSRVLSEGPMGKDRSQLGGFASTGGWTLGRKTAVDLYSKSEIVKLTPDQEKMVEEIAANVYRPCCGNPTSFPDCNHGMAALGLAEYLAAKGLGQEEIYGALLKFNSYWFSQTYLDMAAYFQLQGTPWSAVNPQLALSADYSSGQGYSRLKKELDAKTGVQPPTGGSGRGCGT